MRIKAIKYLLTLIIPYVVYISFTNTGWLSYLPVIVAFVLIPCMELLMKPDEQNLSDSEAEIAARDPFYDLIIYLTVPMQFYFLFTFLHIINQNEAGWPTTLGRVLAMGLMCGIYGINVAHELGHRSKWYEQLMAKALLFTSLYIHFFIEHNRGHHKQIGTPDDPASAPKGESIYKFWIRSVWYSYLDAWKLERVRLQKNGEAFYSFKNEMIDYHILQMGFLVVVYASFGMQTLLLYVMAALIGILLLETVNYIEHYGLRRKQQEDGGYQRVMHQHSWNSSHPIGRMMLFELTRHSDHHYKASRKYQLLKHHDEGPKMPTGYPGMMILSLFPKLWFKVMDRRVDDAMNEENRSLSFRRKLVR